MSNDFTSDDLLSLFMRGKPDASGTGPSPSPTPSQLPLPPSNPTSPLPSSAGGASALESLFKGLSPAPTPPTAVRPPIQHSRSPTGSIGGADGLLALLNSAGSPAPQPVQPQVQAPGVSLLDQLFAGSGVGIGSPAPVASPSAATPPAHTRPPPASPRPLASASESASPVPATSNPPLDSDLGVTTPPPPAHLSSTSASTPKPVFDFVSPFDLLAASTPSRTAGTPKKETAVPTGPKAGEASPAPAPVKEEPAEEPAQEKPVQEEEKDIDVKKEVEELEVPLREAAASASPSAAPAPELINPARNYATSPSSAPTALSPAQHHTIHLSLPNKGTLLTGATGVEAITILKNNIAYAPGGGQNVSVSAVICYSMSKGRTRLIDQTSGARALLRPPPTAASAGPLVDIAVAPGARLAGVTETGVALVWSFPETFATDNPACQVVLQVHGGVSRALWVPGAERSRLALVRGGEVLIVALRDVGGKTLRVEELRKVALVLEHGQPVLDLAFSPDGTALSVAHGHKITTWSLPRGGASPSSTQEPTIIARHTLSSASAHPISSLHLTASPFLILSRDRGRLVELYPLSLASHAHTHPSASVHLSGGAEDGYAVLQWEERSHTIFAASSERQSLFAISVEAEEPDPAAADHGSGSTAAAIQAAQASKANAPRPSVRRIVEMPLPADVSPVTNFTVTPPVKSGARSVGVWAVHPGGIARVDVDLAALPGEEEAAKEEVLKEVVERQREDEAAWVPETPLGEELKDERWVEAGRALQNGVGREVEVEEVKEKEKTKAKRRESVRGGASSEGLREVEDRLSRLLITELEKQQRHLSSTLLSSQSADLARQERLVQLISDELASNTTKVVQAAIASAVSAQVLPAVEEGLARELGREVERGLGGVVKQILPGELERLLLRSDFSSGLARSLTASVTPALQRGLEKSLSETIYAASEETRDLLRDDIANELLNIRKEIVSPDTGSNDSLLRDMARSIQQLTQQVKTLSNQVATLQQQQQLQQAQPPVHAHSRAPSVTAASGSSPLRPTPMNGPAPASPVVAPLQRLPPLPREEHEVAFHAVLQSKDIRRVKELLVRVNIDEVLPLGGGKKTVTQPVIVTLLRQLAEVPLPRPFGREVPLELRWLDRAASSINFHDPQIAPYLPKVVEVVGNEIESRIRALLNLNPSKEVVEAQQLLRHAKYMLTRS